MWLDNDGVYGVQELIMRLIFLIFLLPLFIASFVAIGGFLIVLIASLISCVLFPVVII